MKDSFKKFFGLILTFCTLVCSYGYGQTDSAGAKEKNSTKDNELGLNLAFATSLFGNNFSNNLWYYYIYDGPYDYYYPFFNFQGNEFGINYRHYFGRNAAGAGLGGNYFNGKNQDDDGDIVKYNASTALVKISFDRESVFSGNWQVYYGLSGSFFSTKNKYAVDFLSSFTNDYNGKNTTNTFEGGPVLGFRYRFADRFSISADASLKASYFKNKNSSGSFFNTTTGFNIYFSPLTGLFFNYYF